MVYHGMGYNYPLPFLSDFWFQVEKWNLARMDTHVRPWKYFGSHNMPQPFQKESMSANQKINWIPTRQIGQFPKRRFEAKWKFITSINSKLSALRRCFCAKQNQKTQCWSYFSRFTAFKTWSPGQQWSLYYIGKSLKITIQIYVYK